MSLVTIATPRVAKFPQPAYAECYIPLYLCASVLQEVFCIEIMPKVKESSVSKLKNYVSQYGEKVFSTDGVILYCKICDVRVGAEKKFSVDQHVNREKHKRGLQRLQGEKQVVQQMLFGQVRPSGSPFFTDLCEALISADIPLAKLNNTKFKEFLEKYTGKTVPDSSTLRKNYVGKCYEKTMEEIIAKVNGKKIWVCMDETTDSQGRYVANVVVGTLEESMPGDIFLINCEQLEKVNFSTISKLFDRSLSLLYPGGIQHDNVLLLLTDAAPYMVKAATSLQALY